MRATKRAMMFIQRRPARLLSALTEAGGVRLSRVPQRVGW